MPDQTTAPPEPRKYLLERVDDAAVVQAYADGFETLPLKEKTLIWHLYNAAIAGRDIYYDQGSAHGLEMREILEGILTHPDKVEAEALAEIRRYTKLFWINSGPYNNQTSQQVRPESRACGVCPGGQRCGGIRRHAATAAG